MEISPTHGSSTPLNIEPPIEPQDNDLEEFTKGLEKHVGMRVLHEVERQHRAIKERKALSLDL